MDDLINEILAGMQHPEEQWHSLDDRVPPPVRVPANEQWGELMSEAMAEFEVDGATAAFSTWRIETEDPLHSDGIEALADWHLMLD